jgi:murein DD-endopeptidase MepM/ murein hydrolase activator NlpD
VSVYLEPMRTHGPFGVAAVVIFTIASGTAGAQQARLTLSPKQASGGTLTLVTLDRAIVPDDSIVSITGTMGGEPLHFRVSAPGKLQALGAVPIDVSDSLVARVRIERQSGAVDSARLSVKYPHHAPTPTTPVQSRGRVANARRLKVDKKFTKKMDAETEERIERENETAREVGRKAQDTPQLWTLPFLKPRPTKVTSKFGSGRVFNGKVASSHLGMDYRGREGEPIVAANRGIVALVAEFFLAGNVVYIDHGDGVVTGYFHMSKPEVAVGDTVERGQEIGLVGATGRVTGPHLHWSARFGSLTINPGDLFALRPPFVDGLTIHKEAP